MNKFLEIYKTRTETTSLKPGSTSYKDWLIKIHSERFVLLAIHPKDFVHIFARIEIPE